MAGRIEWVRKWTADVFLVRVGIVHSFYDESITYIAEVIKGDRLVKSEHVTTTHEADEWERTFKRDALRQLMDELKGMSDE